MTLRYSLVATFLLLCFSPNLFAQGAVSFSSGNFAGSNFSVSFTAGETFSGTYEGSGITLKAGILSFTEQLSTSTTGENPETPQVFKLNQNYPNPFNPSTTIQYDLPKASNVKIEVYNVIGVRVATLVDDQKTAGSHTTQFDASSLASGMYLYRLLADGALIATKKMMLIK